MATKKQVVAPVEVPVVAQSAPLDESVAYFRALNPDFPVVTKMDQVVNVSALRAQVGDYEEVSEAVYLEYLAQREAALAAAAKE